MEGSTGAPKDELTAHSEFKARALKELARAGKHDKCGVVTTQNLTCRDGA